MLCPPDLAKAHLHSRPLIIPMLIDPLSVVFVRMLVCGR
jgi:hypothetical protein